MRLYELTNKECGSGRQGTTKNCWPGGRPQGLKPHPPYTGAASIPPTTVAALLCPALVVNSNFYPSYPAQTKPCRDGVDPAPTERTRMVNVVNARTTGGRKCHRCERRPRRVRGRRTQSCRGRRRQRRGRRGRHGRYIDEPSLSVPAKGGADRRWPPVSRRVGQPIHNSPPPDLVQRLEVGQSAFAVNAIAAVSAARIPSSSASSLPPFVAHR